MLVQTNEAPDPEPWDCCCILSQCFEILLLISAVILFSVYMSIDCTRPVAPYDIQVELDNMTIIIIDDCVNQKTLDILLAISISVATAAGVALLSVIRHCTRYCHPADAFAVIAVTNMQKTSKKVKKLWEDTKAIAVWTTGLVRKTDVSKFEDTAEDLPAVLSELSGEPSEELQNEDGQVGSSGSAGSEDDIGIVSAPTYPQSDKTQSDSTSESEENDSLRRGGRKQRSGGAKAEHKEADKGGNPAEQSEKRSNDITTPEEKGKEVDTQPQDSTV